MMFGDEVALVTGAGRGFGRAIAMALAAQGAKVGVVARTGKDVEAVASQIRDAGGDALAIQADVTRRSDVERSIHDLEQRFGPITQFVNNAGVGWPYGPVGDMDVDRWWEAQRLHQLAPMLYLSRLLPRMSEAGRGRVVLVSAIASHMTVPHMSAYITGKTAQVRIAAVAALEVKARGVSIFAIDPGFVITSLARETMTSPEAMQYLPDMVGRLKEMAELDGSEGLRACGQRVVDLFSGRFDALSGGYFEMSQSLDAELQKLSDQKQSSASAG